MKATPTIKENIYFVVNIILAIGVVLLLISPFLAGSAAGSPKGSITTMLVTYIVMILLFFIVRHGLTIGHIQGNGVRLTESQFPLIHQVVLDQCQKLDLKRPPAVYMLQSGGLLNAFATRSGGKNYVVLYSDIMEKAFEEGLEVVSFIIGHELAHAKRRHVTRLLFTLPAAVVFPFRMAYSRACEYTCDRYATELAPSGAEQGMLLLAAGKRLFARINTEELIRSYKETGGFWKWLTGIMFSHPFIPRRIEEIRKMKARLALAEQVPAQQSSGVR